MWLRTLFIKKTALQQSSRITKDKTQNGTFIRYIVKEIEMTNTLSGISAVKRVHILNIIIPMRAGGYKNISSIFPSVS